MGSYDFFPIRFISYYKGVIEASLQWLLKDNVNRQPLAFNLFDQIATHMQPWLDLENASALVKW